MSALRTAKVTVLLAPDVLDRLDAWRHPRRWSRSTAIAAMIEEALGREQDEASREDQP